MQTTIDIDDQLLKYAKLQATQKDCTLKQGVEVTLREFLSRQRLETEPLRLETMIR
jgi:hypothetical protein